MSQTRVLETRLGLPGPKNHDIRDLAPCLSFSRMPSSKDCCSHRDINALMLSGGAEPLCSQAGLSAGGRASRSADTFVDCASAILLPGLPAYQRMRTVRLSSGTHRPLQDDCIARETAAYSRSLSKCLIKCLCVAGPVKGRVLTQARDKLSAMAAGVHRYSRNELCAALESFDHLVFAHLWRDFCAGSPWVYITPRAAV